MLAAFLSFALAASVQETFSTTEKKESATAVWNQTMGIVHPALLVTGMDNGTPQPDITFDVGDGRHGIFDSSTYANFSINGNLAFNTIRIDTSVYPILQVTDFVLDNGWTLEPVGTAPLIIYSQKDIIINGTIQCSGNIGTSGGPGGDGRCGGANGGAGGGNTTSGGDGTDISVTITGGRGATYAGLGNGAGGGGGGSFNTDAATAGPAGAGGNVFGAAGANSPNHDFTIIAGGAGGGGGSGSGTNPGSGGGGGGGVVIIHAYRNLTISATGSILADGGAGGAAIGDGGVGGGGGGGAIKIFIGADLTMTNANTVSAYRGLGGAGGAPGRGSWGRTWLVATNFLGAGSEQPTTLLANPGSFAYATSAQEVISKSFDLQNTQATINSIVADISSADIAFQVAGSEDDFAADDTGWKTTAQFSEVAKKRYIKFKLILTNSNALVPTTISSVTLDYTPGSLEEFNFKGGCGVVSNHNTPSGPLFLLLLPFLMALFLKFRYRPSL